MFPGMAVSPISCRSPPWRNVTEPCQKDNTAAGIIFSTNNKTYVAENAYCSYIAVCAWCYVHGLICRVEQIINYDRLRVT